MWDREQLETFAVVVEQQSFERAAAFLNVTRSAVSLRIKSLEAAMASVLLVRDKPVVPTPAGELVLRHVSALRLLEAGTAADLLPSPGAQPPRLAVAVNADSLATWFPGVAWPLLRQLGVALEILADDQDHTLAKLARGLVVGCVSTEARAASGFVAEPLGTMEYRCYAARDFVDRYFPRGLTLQAAIQAPAVLFDRKDTLHDEFLQRLFGLRVERYVRHYVPAPGVLLEAILAGVGYGLVPVLQAKACAHDRLVDLAPAQSTRLDLFWHHWAAEPPMAKLLTRHVVAGARRMLCECAPP